MGVPMRLRYQEKLTEIHSDVIRMGNEALDMVRHAAEGALSHDAEVLEQVLAQDDVVDALERALFMKTVVIVMQEQPVAQDLRLLVSTLGVVGEIEKVADNAVKLARRSQKLGQPIPVELRKPFSDIAELARRQFAASLKLYSEYDSALAREIIHGDNEVDRAYSAARNQIFGVEQADQEQLTTLYRTVESFHALEHISDNSVEIARRLRMLYELEMDSA
jgi:phosphate transport system protein